ncbi:MAG TPA: hypothetical protein VGO93_06725 [Candidatus Xenobia bacterium]
MGQHAYRSYKPGHGHWLWHVKQLPTWHPVTSAHPMLDKLQSIQPQPAPPAVSADAHPLAWTEEALGLDAYQRLVEGR